MLTIGEFAWLSQVTVDALRHYDKLNLLKLAHLDRFTGYRYYSLTQLPRLNLILALKELGLPLSEIGRLLDQPILGPAITHMFDEVGEHLDRQKVTPAGPGIALWHESQFVHTDVNQEEIDLETLCRSRGRSPRAAA